MSSSPKSSINTPSISRFTHFKTGQSPSSSASPFAFRLGETACDATRPPHAALFGSAAGHQPLQFFNGGQEPRIKLWVG